MRQLAPVAFVALVACGAPQPAPALPGPMHRTLDAIVDGAASDPSIVGASIVVLRGDRVEYARGVGFADLDKRLPATEHSVYPYASLTKQFWATALAQLVDAHRVDVAMPVADVLPAFPDRRVTIRQLLTHTSGLGDDRSEEDDATFADLKLDFEPGSWWQYSNRGSLIVRQIVERVSGESWDAYLHAHIARPLDLPSLHTCGTHVPLYDRTRKPAGLSDADMARIQFVCGDAVDAARFELALDRGTLVSPATLAAMRTPVQIEDLGPLPYGWFTRVGDIDGHAAFGHTGNFPGVNVAAFRLPADDLTIVVLMNTEPRRGLRAYELVMSLARALLSLRAPTPTPIDRPVPAGELAAIAGDYLDPSGHARITARDGRAWLTLLDGDKPVFEGALVWLGGRRFAGGPTGIEPDMPVTFVPAAGPVGGALIGHRLLLDGVTRHARP